MPYDGTSLNDTAAHLLRAKRYIEEHGWLQDSLGEQGGPRCMYGALLSTSQGSDPDRLVVKIGCDVLRRDVPLWNDAPGRTIEEVYAAFDRAIALALESDKK